MRFPRFATLISVALVSAVAADLSAQEVRRHINPRSATDSTALPFSGAVLGRTRSAPYRGNRVDCSVLYIRYYI